MARRPSLLVPLGCYLAVCVGVPLFNGGGPRPGFWSHALEVSLAAVGVALAFRVLRRRRV